MGTNTEIHRRPVQGRRRKKGKGKGGEGGKEKVRNKKTGKGRTMKIVVLYLADSDVSFRIKYYIHSISSHHLVFQK